MRVEYIMDYSEVDAALAAKLTGLGLDYHDPATGELKTPLRPVPVTYYDPDIDFQDADYPVFVIYRISENLDTSRWSSDLIVDNWVTRIDPISGKEVAESVDTRLAPEPWNVYYTIRLITQFQSDLIAMSRFYHQKFPRSAYLKIKNVAYDISPVSANLFGAGYQTFGVIKEAKREFVQEYGIKVEVSLDIHSPSSTKTAQEIIFNIKEK